MNFNILFIAGLALVSAKFNSKSSSRQGSESSSVPADSTMDNIVAPMVEEISLIMEDCDSGCSHMHCGRHHEHHGCHEECSHVNPEHECHEGCHHWVRAESASTGSQ
jgi:hypothetical protein